MAEVSPTHKVICLLCLSDIARYRGIIIILPVSLPDRLHVPFSGDQVPHVYSGSIINIFWYYPPDSQVNGYFTSCLSDTGINHTIIPATATKQLRANGIYILRYTVRNRRTDHSSSAREVLVQNINLDNRMDFQMAFKESAPKRSNQLPSSKRHGHRLPIP